MHTVARKHAFHNAFTGQHTVTIHYKRWRFTSVSTDLIVAFGTTDHHTPAGASKSILRGLLNSFTVADTQN